ncbi:sortase-dependent protein [Streptomyces sp. NPDC004752]
MRRIVLSVMTLACTAVLAGTAPAFADGTTPSEPTRAATPANPVATPATEPTRVATPANPVATPATEPTKAPKPVPSRVPGIAETRAPSRGQVSVVPEGAPDTGVTAPSEGSGSSAGLLGGGAAAVLVAAGGAVFVVRRRRAAGTAGA